MRQTGATRHVGGEYIEPLARCAPAGVPKSFRDSAERRSSPARTSNIEERFIFDNGGQRYTYVATITDPTVYTRPWTITIPARRRNVDEPEDGWHYEAQLANLPGKPPLAERYERVCVENNGPFGQLSVTPSK